MSLSPLQWRKLPVRVIATGSISTSYFLDTIYDMLTGSVYHDGTARSAGVGSAWQNPTKYITGSNTEAVYCSPPLATELSQSVIFSAKNTTGAVTSATPAVVTNETTYAAGVIHAAVVKYATGSFTQWTSTFPFGSSSYSSGYARLVKAADFVTGEKVIIYESTEAIAVVAYNPTTPANNVVVAGAIIDPEQSGSAYDTETDGRIYGIATNGTATVGVTGISSTFLTDALDSPVGSLFNHSTTANTTGNSGYSRFVIFTPNFTSLSTISLERNLANVYTATYTTLSGKLVQAPLRCYGRAANNFIGRLRDITITRPILSNQIVKDGSNNIVGFTLTTSELSANHTAVFNYA
jgi:hypothetical protein